MVESKCATMLTLVEMNQVKQPSGRQCRCKGGGEALCEGGIWSEHGYANYCGAGNKSLFPLSRRKFHVLET